jgi:hypothetical protein
MPAYQTYVRTPDGWQPLIQQAIPFIRTVTTLPSPGAKGDMVLYTLPPATTPTVWFYDGTAWQQVGTGAGGASRAFGFFSGGVDG